MEVCEPHPPLVKGTEKEGSVGAAETPRWSESGHVSQRWMCCFSPHLKEIYPKAVAGSSGFWVSVGQGGCREGHREGDLTFSSLRKRTYYSWETKDLIVSMLEFRNRLGDSPEGIWAQRTWMISCNFDLFHISITEPAFWNWPPCLFCKLILLSISYLMAVEKKSPSCLNSCLCGLLLIKGQPAYHRKVFPTLIDLASDFLAENFPGCRGGVKWFAAMVRARREGPSSIWKWHLTGVTSWNQKSLF